MDSSLIIEQDSLILALVLVQPRKIRPNITEKGAHWLTGRMLDLRLRGCGFEPHQRHCVVHLSKTLYPLLSTGSTQEDLSRHV